MQHFQAGKGGKGMDLQGTIAASSYYGPNANMAPHHPISCQQTLAYHDDGRLACPHVTADAGNERTRRALCDSIAWLIIEEAAKL